MKSKDVLKPPAIARIARRSRSNFVIPGSRSARPSSLGAVCNVTRVPVVDPPRGRIASSGRNGQANVNCLRSGSSPCAAPRSAAASSARSPTRLRSVTSLRRRSELCSRLRQDRERSSLLQRESSWLFLRCSHCVDEAEIARERELDGHLFRIEAEREPQEIQLEALFDTGENAKQPQDTELPARSARRYCNEVRA